MLYILLFLFYLKGDETGYRSAGNIYNNNPVERYPTSSPFIIIKLNLKNLL